MATIREEILIDASPDDVWSAVRDVGAVHERLAQGFVIDTQLAGEERVVTFANGIVVRELLVDIDEPTRRLAYTAVGGRTTHHNASLQVLADGTGRTRLVWITDVLPHDADGPIRSLVEQGVVAIKQTLEQQAAAR